MTRSSCSSMSLSRNRPMSSPSAMPETSLRSGSTWRKHSSSVTSTSLADHSTAIFPKYPVRSLSIRLRPRLASTTRECLTPIAYEKKKNCHSYPFPVTTSERSTSLPSRPLRRSPTRSHRYLARRATSHVSSLARLTRIPTSA